MHKAVKYKDAWLMPGSTAFELHEKGEMVKLDKHLQQLDRAFQELHGAPGDKPKQKGNWQ